jgi:hypothetical protein
MLDDGFTHVPAVWIESDPRSPKQGVFYGRGTEPVSRYEKFFWFVIGVVLMIWFCALGWAISKFLEAIQ